MLYHAFNHSGAVITDIKGTGFVKNTEKRAVAEGCQDDGGKQRTVGERWKLDGGYCKCYEGGNIGCVGEPVTVPPRRLLLLDDFTATMLCYFKTRNVVHFSSVLLTSMVSLPPAYEVQWEVMFLQVSVC